MNAEQRPREPAAAVDAIANNTAILLPVFAGNMVLGLVGTYLSARYLGIDDFGRLSLALAVVGMIGLARSGVATTITKLSAARTYDDATLLVAGSTIQVALTAALAVVAIPAVLIADGDRRLLWAAVLIAGAMALQSTYEIRAAIMAGKDQMSGQLTSTAALALTVLIAWLCFAILDLRLEAWPTAMFVSVVVVASWTWYRAGAGPLSWAIRPDLFASVLRSTIALSGIALLQQLHWNLDAPILRLLGSPTQLGVFAAGTRLLPPVRTIAVLLTMATLPTLSRGGDRSVVAEQVNAGVRQLGMIGCVLAILVYTLAEPLTVLLFPNSFLSAAEVMAIGALTIAPVLLQWAFLNVLWIHNRWLPLAMAYLVAISVKCVGGYFLVPRVGAVGSAWVLVGSELIAAAIMAGATQHLVRNSTPRGIFAAAITVATGVSLALAGGQLGAALGAVLGVTGLIVAGGLSGALRTTDLAAARAFANRLLR